MAASDDYYSYWPGLSCGREDCIYHLCQGNPERCKSLFREELSLSLSLSQAREDGDLRWCLAPCVPQDHP